MKSGVILSSIASCLAATLSYASPDSAPANVNHVYLDQSKNVFFEQFSSNSFSLQLLKNKNKFNDQDIVLGGSAQFDWQHWQGDKIDITPPPPPTYQQGTEFFFTQANFDVMSNLNTSWATVFLAPADSQIAQGGQDANNIYFQHAFLLFGNLDKIPVYLTLGINTIPFGSFSGSGAWNTPLTSNYFNPAQSPQISLGYYKNNLNAVLTEYEDQINYGHHWVYSVFYNNAIKLFNYGFGAGYLTHLYSNSTGNAATNPTRNRIANIALFNLGDVKDLNASIGYGPVTLTGEYLNGSNKVGINRNNTKALGETLSYVHPILGKDTTFGIGYSNSINLNGVPTALSGQDAVPLAASGIRKSWVASASRSIFNKYFSLGFNAERDFLYSRKTTNTYTLDLMAYL